jgi:hypothetical protein
MMPPGAWGSAPVAAAAAATVAVLALVGQGARGWAGMPIRVAAAAALAALAALAPLRDHPAAVPAAIALTVAVLARERHDPRASECGVKLLWCLAGVFALAAVGWALLSLATGTVMAAEQWRVAGIGLVPRIAWSAALGLFVLAGCVLVGSAPFHFWLADVAQAGVPWLAGPAGGALQAGAAAALLRVLGGIDSAPEAAATARTLFATAAVAGFGLGAITLAGPRGPERRAGTLAGLQGALFLAALVATPAGAAFGAVAGPLLERWAAHLVLAGTGAALLAPCLPVTPRVGGPGAPLARAHPLAALAGAWALGSLAGVPGTPGAALWLDVARALARSGHTLVLVSLGAAWLVAFATVVNTVRLAWGSPTRERAAPAPLAIRIGLLTCGVALVLQALAWRFAH